MSVVGTCRLCQRSGVELKDSHLLPRNIYKSIRRAEGADNSLVAVSKDSAHFTDKQVHDYLLCGECEQRFGVFERFVSSQCLQSDGMFRLRDIVVAQPLFGNPKDRVISGRAAGIEVDRYGYFASSILWRAGVHGWPQVGKIELGPYEERLRLYLHDGQAAFPTDCVVAMHVATNAAPADQFAEFPTRISAQGYHHYEFAIPGIQFQLLLGQRIPSSLRTACVIRSQEGLVFLDHHLSQRALIAAMRTARVTNRVQKGADQHKNRSAT